MRTALNTRPWFQTIPKPPALAANKLSSIKVKDYSLIGFRDYEAETDAKIHLEFLNSKIEIRPPRLYTLISQNRKISIKESLNNSQRFFLNFESFKWSELFFNFFREIVSPATEQFVFQNLLYSIDFYVCQFQLLTVAARNVSLKTENALHRRKNQFELISMIQNHQHSEKLFLLFIFELLLISLGKNQYTSCSTFVTRAESQILLNFFKSEGLVNLESDKLLYSEDYLKKSLKKYSAFRGQILLTEDSKNIFAVKQLQQFKNIYEGKESVLEHRAFETCFTHA